MRLFNASSLFENADKEISKFSDSPEKLRNKIIEIKNALLQMYKFKVYNQPKDFTENSYIIATNHLTDSDAPLIMSYYYDVMKDVKSEYPVLFVFAKENCFNGVSISQNLLPILEMEKVFAVDRTSLNGSIVAIRAAQRWFAEGEKPKHFLIFAQGTIYDINKDKAEDIERGAFWLAKLLGIPVLPAFIEQAIEGEENRLIFGDPISVPSNTKDLDEYKQVWIDRVIAAENELGKVTGRPARETVLDADHQVRKKIQAK
jgi:1-acyl-sn-glycerol-3-phosphate acyltransferase